MIVNRMRYLLSLVMIAAAFLAACGESSTGGATSTTTVSKSFLESLKASAEFRSDYPGSTFRSEDEDPVCSPFFHDPPGASRSLDYDGNLDALFGFYRQLWEKAGWNLSRGPQGRQPNGQSHWGYEKDFGEWVGGLSVTADSLGYTVTAEVLDPECP
ncbi:MAG: hypothetical protein ACRDT1_10230 [Micromonosporaceae bacterium]